MNMEDHLLSLCVDRSKGFSGKISSICSDSRQVIPGSVFVALKGQKQDGHHYLQSAAEKGAQVLVVEKEQWIKQNSFRGMVCVVPDTRSILPVLLNQFYDHPSEKMFCVGVTGTNGKTTVSNMLAFLFSHCGWRTGMIGTIKNSFENKEEKSTLTTPNPVQLYGLLNRFQKKGAQAVVIEVSSIGLDQKRVEGLDFNLGVFTNLSEDHLDYHHNMQEYFQAKKKLFKMPRSFSVGKNHFMAVLNMDDPYGVKLAEDIQTPHISYGRKNARFSYKILSVDLSGTRFVLYFDDRQIEVFLPIPGIYNVSNAVSALCCVYSAGFSLEKAVSALKHFPGVPGRMQRVCPDRYPLVFVDYAHTPQALKSVLNFLSSYCLPFPFTSDTQAFINKNKKPEIPNTQQSKTGRLITVFGCGGERDREKRPLMAQAAENFSNKVIITSDNPRGEDPMDIINDCMKGVNDKRKFIIEPDRRQAIRQALKNTKKTDIVLIAGKGHEREQIIGSKRHAFSDAAVVREYFT